MRRSRCSRKGLQVDSINADLWEYLGKVSLNKGTAAATEEEGQCDDHR